MPTTDAGSRRRPAAAAPAGGVPTCSGVAALATSGLMLLLSLLGPRASATAAVGAFVPSLVAGRLRWLATTTAASAPGGNSSARRGAAGTRMMASASSVRPPANLLAQIRRHSQVIVDTADYLQLEALPLVTEATTNPSIVWQAAQQEKYFHLLEEACNMYRPTLGVDGIMDMLEAVPVKFARELYRRLPPKGRRVYFQLDPRHSFDTDLAVDKARFLVKLAADYHNIPRESLVLKIPGSWEGIQAAKQLEQEGVACLVTAVTCIVQAAAAAEAGASYVAPYVGRVTDWKGEESTGADGEMGVERGVRLARDAQLLFRARGWGKTKVMAASIRGPEQAKALAGCDVLTIGPPLLIRLECDDPVDEDADGGGGVPSFLPEGPISLPEHLSPKAQKLLGIAGCSEAGGAITEAKFREALAADACGTQVFAQGMKLFLMDLRSLEKVFFDYLSYVDKSQR